MSLMWFGLNPGLVIFRHSNPAVTQLVLLMDKNPAGDRANSAVSGRRDQRGHQRKVVTKLGKPMCQPPRP